MANLWLPAPVICLVIDCDFLDMWITYACFLSSDVSLEDIEPTEPTEEDEDLEPAKKKRKYVYQTFRQYPTYPSISLNKSAN